MGVLSLFSTTFAIATAHLPDFELLFDALLPASVMDFFLRLFRPRVEEGVKVEEQYLLPVYQRRDGATIKLGYLVKRTNGDQTAFVVKQILTKRDMATVTLTLVPYQILMKTGEQYEKTCRVEDVSCVRGRHMEAVVAMARDGMASIAASIPSYPLPVQRQVRKHQLAASLRREVQRFLGDVGQTFRLNLGPVNWRLDPGILGLDRHADFTLDYKIEDFVDKASHLDFLLGRGWDHRSVQGTDNFRIIITLELCVDLNHELCVALHATRCAGIDGESSPRRVCLSCKPWETSATPAVTVQEAGGTMGGSLDWDEFQPVSKECSPWKGQHIPSATVSMEDLLCTASFPANTSTVADGLDKLLSAIPPAKLAFNASPIQEVDESRKEASSLLSGSVGCLSAGPNTSTPADELEGNSSNRSQAGICRDSSPSLPEEPTADSRLGILESNENTEEGARKRLSGHFNLETLVNPDDIRQDSVTDIKEGFKNTEEKAQEMKADDTTSHSAVSGDKVHAKLNPTSLDSKSEAKTLLEMKEACGDGFLPPSSPFPSSLAKVAEYLKVQMPVEMTTPPALEDAASADPGDISIASSHSHSVASRQSDLSSLSGARMRGLFHGTALAANNSPVCPFPEEWQYNIIPEVIENEEDID